MKRIIIATVISVLLLTSAHAQKISQKEAQQFLENVWGYFKTSDSASFINLWSPEDSVWQKYHKPLAELKLNDQFNSIKGWLSYALSENLNIDRVEIGKEDARGTEIMATFKPKEHENVGFSLHVIHLNNKWICRGDMGIIIFNKVSK